MQQPFDIHVHAASAASPQAVVNIRFPEPGCLLPGCYYSVGIHPWDLPLFRASEPDWELFEAYAAHPQVVAIGECGIDRVVHGDALPQQEELFLAQQQVAARLQKPLLIHNVRATDLLLRLLPLSGAHSPWVIHGFRGNATHAQLWIGRGAYLSFGARYNEEALCQTPLNRLLLESDTSDLSISAICCRIAASRAISPEELSKQVAQNVQRLFFHR